MRPLKVSLGQKGKDWQEIDIYYKKGPQVLGLKTLQVYVENGELKSFWHEKEYEGLLCLHCKKPILKGTADGHMMLTEDKGLCGECAETKEIYNKYVGVEQEE